MHYPFQLMVALGFVMLSVTAWFWFRVLRRRGMEPGRMLLMLIAASSPLGFLAVEAGWMVTEFGRQPWIIYGVMRTSEAVTPREGIGLLLLVFVLVYVVLAASTAFLLLGRRQRAGLAATHA